MTDLSDLSADLQKQVYELAKGGRIYMATHTIRKATRLGSKPAKALVMEILQLGESTQTGPAVPSSKPRPWADTRKSGAETSVDYGAPFSELDNEMQAKILGWIDSSNKITAIKALRAETGVDLTSAVQIINTITTNRN